MSRIQTYSIQTYHESSDSMKEEINKNPRLYLYMPDLPLEIVKEVLVKYPSRYFDIKNPSRDVNLFLVRNHGYFLAHVLEKYQDEEICIEAIRAYPYALRNVKIGITEEMCRECVLSFVKHEPKQFHTHSILRAVPEEILGRDSFRRFLIDHGLFEFLR